MIREDGLLKYPRTPHLEGSKLQKGDSTHGQANLSQLTGGVIVVEEKMDGANCGVSFSDTGELRLQSRGHFLTGGSRERHFNLLKRWARAHEDILFDVLSNRYIMFGEWMFAKHSVYYDALPHYFLEFDIFDKHEEVFLSTACRHELLSSSAVVSVPLLWSGLEISQQDLESLIGVSLGRTPNWMESLGEEVKRREIDLDKTLAQTDQDERVEGLYIKVEDESKVLSRYKFIRSSFTQSILDQGDHWQRRPLIANSLRPGVDIFSPTVDKSWTRKNSFARSGKATKPR